MQSREKCGRCQRRRDRHPEMFTEGLKTCSKCLADRKANRHRWASKSKLRRGQNKRTPAVVCGRRFCSDCKRWRHIVDFGVQLWEDPIERIVPKMFRQICHHCERLRGRVRNAKLAGRAEPYGQWKPRRSREDRNRAHIERHKERMKTDPVYAEHFRERQRIWAEGKRRERGAKNIREGKVLPGYGERLPVEPLKQWFESKLDNGYMQNQVLLAIRCGIDARAIHRIINLEYESVSEDFVDHALLSEGSTYLWEIYPELYGMTTTGS